MRRAAGLLAGGQANELPETFWYSVKRRMLGPPMVTEQLKEERLSKPLALGVLSCDGISSANYGSELILHELLPFFGLASFTLLMPLTGVILLGIFPRAPRRMPVVLPMLTSVSLRQYQRNTRPKPGSGQRAHGHDHHGGVHGGRPGGPQLRVGRPGEPDHGEPADAGQQHRRDRLGRERHGDRRPAAQAISTPPAGRRPCSAAATVPTARNMAKPAGSA